MSGANAFKE